MSVGLHRSALRPYFQDKGLAGQEGRLQRPQLQSAPDDFDARALRRPAQQAPGPFHREKANEVPGQMCIRDSSYPVTASPVTAAGARR